VGANAWGARSIEAHGPNAFISAQHTAFAPAYRALPGAGLGAGKPDGNAWRKPDASGGAGRDRPKHDCWIEACGASQQGKDKAKRPSVQLNEESVPTRPQRQFNMVKHALSKQTIRCTIQTALLCLVPALAMCVAFALGRAEHHRCECDIHALSSTIDAGNVSATTITMREVRVPALTSSRPTCVQHWMLHRHDPVMPRGHRYPSLQHIVSYSTGILCTITLRRNRFKTHHHQILFVLKRI